MRTESLLLLFATAAIASSCSNVRVTTDYDTEADFSSLRTYAWMSRQNGSETGARKANEIVERRIVSAIDRTLAAKGFRKIASTRTADFLVGQSMVLDRKVGAHVIDHSFGYPHSYFRGGCYAYPWIPPRREVIVYEYDVGTIVVDVATAGKKLIWRGSARSRLNPNITPERSKELIDRAVGQLFERFPPETKRP